MADGDVTRHGLIESTVDNTYFASVVGASGGGFLECYKDYRQRTQLVISPPSDNTPISARIARTDDGTHWTSKFLATCETPEVHELPLTDGWTPLADDCTYYKTQENIVTVNIRARHSTAIPGISRETVATLPTGFRPTGWISSACALDSADSGGAINGGVHVDANGSVIINGFDSYRVVYTQISFLAVN